MGKPEFNVSDKPGFWDYFFGSMVFYGIIALLTIITALAFKHTHWAMGIFVAAESLSVITAVVLNNI